MSASEDQERNRELWTRTNVKYTDAAAEAQWREEEISWGMWAVPEREVGALPDVEGLDVVDLGCGTGYFAAWLARRGARVVGVDPTPAQLETARRMQSAFGLEFPLIEAGAEEVPLPDASFDLVFSEYGASIWADPHRWIAEAARLLRPNGTVVFLRNSTLVILCSPDDGQATERLMRPQFGMYRFEWPEGGVEFQLPHGEWIRLLRSNGFAIEALHELQAPAGAQLHPEYDFVTPEWARRWPAEEIWVARKADDAR
jgi:ubiquinone/menaquinone biosynthesis C-methylase UbiE